MSQNANEELQEAARKLRACRSLALRVETLGLDIDLSEADAVALADFEQAWQETAQADRPDLLALSGLSSGDVVGIIELIKHGKSWEVSQQYGE